MEIYPELKQISIDIIDDDHKEMKAKQLALKMANKEKVDQIMKIKASDCEIAHLITSNIFNAHISTMESHNIKA